MKTKRLGDIIFFVAVAAFVIALSVGFAWQHAAKEKAEADIVYKDAQLELLRDELDAIKYDTNGINDWHDGNQGEVRVVEAKVCGTTSEGMTTVEDTEGEQWLVDSIDATEDDELLLFIADNNTIDDKSDDVIIRLYTYKTLD